MTKHCFKMATSNRMFSFRNESHMFFIYDHRWKTEEDDPKDAILYFYPASVKTHDQIALVGGLIGLTDFCLEYIPQVMPQSIKLAGHNFAMLQTEDYILGLSGSTDIPDRFLMEHMQFLWSTFVFYQGSISAIRQRSSEDDFLKELRCVWDLYLPMCQSQGDILGQAFQVLPYVQFHKSKGNLFLHASHILQRSLKHRGVVAGALFNKNKVLCTQFDNTVTRKLLLLMLHSQFPGVEVNSILELPGGVRLIYVYMTRSDCQNLGYRRKTAFSTDETLLTSSSGRKTNDGRNPSPATDSVSSRSKRSTISNGSSPHQHGQTPQSAFSPMARVDSDLSNQSVLYLSSQTNYSPSFVQNSGTDSEVFVDSVSDLKNLRKDSRGRFSELPGDRDLNSNAVMNNSSHVNRSSQGIDAGVRGDQIRGNNSSFQSSGHNKEVTDSAFKNQMGKDQNLVDRECQSLNQSQSQADVENIVDMKGDKNTHEDVNGKEQCQLNGNHLSDGSKKYGDSNDIEKNSQINEQDTVGESNNLASLKNLSLESEDDGHNSQKSAPVGSTVSPRPMSLALKSSSLESSEKQHDAADPLEQISNVLPTEDLMKTLYQQNQAIEESLNEKCNNSGDDSSTLSSYDENTDNQNSSLLSLATSAVDRTKDRLVFDRNDSENSDLGIASPMSEVGRLSPVCEKPSNSGGMPSYVTVSGVENKSGTDFSGDRFGASGGFDVPDPTAPEGPPEKPSEWTPEADGLERMTLYIQGHSDTLLVLLLDKSTNCDKEHIHALWKSCLSHLAELDFDVKNVERYQKDDIEDLGSCYHYMHYDSFTQNLLGSAMFPVTNLANEMVDACVRMHEDFITMPDLDDSIYRSHTAACFGCRSISGEVYFQIGAQGPGNVYWLGDKTFYLDAIAKALLKKDHNISFY